MTENAKTITFVAIGMAAIVIGLLARPSSAELDEETLVNTDLAKNFKNVQDAKELRIVRFDENTDARREFVVAEQDGLWSIPSKDGYPADATEQMAAAATSLMDRKILQVASRNGQEHEQYGVIDPSSPKLDPGQPGVGTRVTMLNDKKEPLVDLIVGKAVKGAEGQRYVREAGRDAVYVIEVDRSKLSTNFEDWIEKDLLKLESWDLQQVNIKDYSAALVQVMSQDGPGLSIERDDRADITLGYNESEGKWAPVKLASFDRNTGKQGEYVDFKLADDEELNEESMNGLKTALGDLKIVDVVRKPAGMSEDLKAGTEFIKNETAFVDLLKKGFTATGGADGAPQDIISSDGEVIATLKNGAEYVLRFGNPTNVANGEKDEAGAPADPAAAKKADGEVHRYMFVMARHNKDAVKQPDLKPLPELPAKEEETKPAAEAAPATEAAPAAAPPADAAAATPAAEGAPAEGATTTTPATPAAESAPADAAKADEPKNEAAAPAETPPAAAEEAKTEAPAGEATAEKEKEFEKVMAERKSIEQENQRKSDEYQALLKKGDEKVKELNLRFGDWYFVVDDDVFKKLRLGRNDVIKKKDPPKTEGAAPPGATNPFPPTGAPPAGLPTIPGAAQ